MKSVWCVKDEPFSMVSLSEASAGGWAMPALLQASKVLLSCAPKTSSLSFNAALLAWYFPDPRPPADTVLAAGCALQAVLELDPLTFSPAAIFLAPPYCPAIATLPLDTLRVLLRTCLLSDLPGPLLEPLTACLAQRYASLPRAQFHTEVGGLFPAWTASVHSWWAARFRALPLSPVGNLPNCVCSYWALHTHVRLPAAFGLESDSSGSECWARGLSCRQAPLALPPTCAAMHALAFGQSEWATGQLPWLSHDLLASPKPGGYERLQTAGPKDVFAGQVLLLQLWSKPDASCPAPEAVGAVLKMLEAHPENGCIALCACGVLSRIGMEQAGGLALLAACPALVKTVLNSQLPAECAGLAVLCLMLHLRSVTDLTAKAQLVAELVASLAPRLAELLQAQDCPKAQLHACCAVHSLSWHASDKAALVSAGVLQPLVRLLDTPGAETREKAVAALGQLALMSWPISAAIVEAGLVPRLLRAVHPQATTLFVRQATYTLYLVVAVSKGGEEQHSLAALLPLLPLLAALLTSNETVVVLYTLGALAKGFPPHSEAGFEAWGQAVLEAGILPRLTAFLVVCDRVAEEALTVLSHLMRGDYLWRQSLVNEGVLQRIAALLPLPGSGRTLRLACIAVLLMCSQHVKAVIGAGCVQGLVGLAESQEQEIAAAACAALGAACREARGEGIDLLVEEGVAGTLCSSLGVDKGRQEGVVLGLEGLLVNSCPPGVHRERLLEAGVREALKLCAESTQGSAQRAAVGVLQRHFA